LDPSMYQMRPLFSKGIVPLSHWFMSGNLTMNSLWDAYHGIILSIPICPKRC
jgi:hypothetical protein